MTPVMIVKPVLLGFLQHSITQHVLPLKRIVERGIVFSLEFNVKTAQENFLMQLQLTMLVSPKKVAEMGISPILKREIARNASHQMIILLPIMLLAPKTVLSDQKKMWQPKTAIAQQELLS